MTLEQKYLAERLLTGNYHLRPTGGKHKRKSYKLFDGQANPLEYITPGTYKYVKEVLKKDKAGRLVISIKAVRSLHGKHFIKRLYKSNKQKS